MQRILAISPYLLSSYLALLIWLSLSPASYYHNLNFQFLPDDTTVHFILYLILSVLLFFVLLRYDNKQLRLGTINIVVATVIGIVMELLQLWFPVLNRSFEWKDVLMNFGGAVSGTLFCFAFLRFFKLKPHVNLF